jgi:DNA-binding NtrC family response regulator
VSRHVDVRVIAATNRDLRQGVRDGRFRLDLYHRLSVFPMRLPALRERAADIAPLAQHFLRQVAAVEGKPVPRIAPDALALLERYSWPGNIRQLKNEVTRLLLLASGGRITSEIVSPDIRDGDPALATDDRPLEEIIRQVKTSVIVDRLRRSGNRPTQAARSLGISREWLWALMRKLGLKPPDEDDDSE